MAHNRYFAAVDKTLETVRRTQADAIEQAAGRIAEAFAGDGILHGFGCGHSGLLIQDIYYRAGGSMLVNPIFAPEQMLHQRPVWLSSRFERLEGYATLLLEGVNLIPEDVMLVVSTSGKNAVPVEMALAAKERGLFVIALTSVEYSSASRPGHPSGKRLYEVADLVLDNGCNVGDATVAIDGLTQKVSPASTVVGSYILQAMMARVAETLQQSGADVPVFFSGNLPNGPEQNDRLMEKYRKRLARCTGF